ncbi:MAG: hypothetical protein RLZZ524_651 [Pseudomonadota bacterium]
MSVAWVGGTAATFATSTSVSRNAPSGLSTGDTLLAAVFARSAITTPSGWTKLLETSEFTDGGTNQRLAVFSKDSVTSADSGASFSWTQASSLRMGVCYAALTGTGANSSSAATENSSFADFKITPATKTATANGQAIVVFASQVITNGSTHSPTPPTSFTLFTGTSVSDCRLGGAYRLVNSGQSNSGDFDFFPGYVEDEFSVPNGFGAITVLVEAAAAGATEGIVSDPGPLQTPSVFAKHPRIGPVVVESILGQPAVVCRFNQFAGLSQAYAMDLVTPGGDVRVPISSWQASLSLDSSGYVQCVVPACSAWVDDITSATEFVIYRTGTLDSGETIEEEVARAPVQTTAYAQGSFNYTATISGYNAAATAGDPLTVTTLSGIQQIFNTNGLTRTRCNIDFAAVPGTTAVVEELEHVISYVNYYVSGTTSFMDVGE